MSAWVVWVSQALWVEAYTRIVLLVREERRPGSCPRTWRQVHMVWDDVSLNANVN